MSYFTVIDLKHAFYSIPLAEESRYQFAFTHCGVKLQYKVLPQGHKNSPGIFNDCLKKKKKKKMSCKHTGHGP